jgi:hypothetical protein
MVRIRLAGAWLFFVGVVALSSSYQLLGVISGRLRFDTAIWLFAAPILLILGSTFLLAHRCVRIAAAAVSLSCVWLTYFFASNYWPHTPNVEYDWLFFASAFIVIAADIAVITIWRRVYHLTDEAPMRVKCGLQD